MSGTWDLVAIEGTSVHHGLGIACQAGEKGL